VPGRVLQQRIEIVLDVAGEGMPYADAAQAPVQCIPVGCLGLGGPTLVLQDASESV
jgi:hypothetical protein